jgi:hypothetical protein
MKYSIVKPLFKKGDKIIISNYRPVYLLPALSKILEKIIYVRLYKQMTIHNVLGGE